MKTKVNQFLTEVAERIHRLKVGVMTGQHYGIKVGARVFKHVNRTTMNRWNAFLLYFGYASSEVKDQKPTAVFKMVIEFALEYRTNRDKIVQVLLYGHHNVSAQLVL